MSRPHEHRIKLTVHVLPVTAKRISYLVDKKKREHSTLGRVVDWQFGVRASRNVADVARAGEGGGVPHERAKHDSTRAKGHNTRS